MLYRPSRAIEEYADDRADRDGPPWYVRCGRGARTSSHRVSTPLELLFDLCFVVAVAQAAAQLDHAIAENHVGTASSAT